MATVSSISYYDELGIFYYAVTKEGEPCDFSGFTRRQQFKCAYYSGHPGIRCNPLGTIKTEGFSTMFSWYKQPRMEIIDSHNSTASAKVQLTLSCGVSKNPNRQEKTRLASTFFDPALKPEVSNQNWGQRTVMLSTIRTSQ